MQKGKPYLRIHYHPEVMAIGGREEGGREEGGREGGRRERREEGGRRERREGGGREKKKRKRKRRYTWAKSLVQGLLHWYTPAV